LGGETLEEKGESRPGGSADVLRRKKGLKRGLWGGDVGRDSVGRRGRRVFLISRSELGKKNGVVKSRICIVLAPTNGGPRRKTASVQFRERTEQNAFQCVEAGSQKMRDGFWRKDAKGKKSSDKKLKMPVVQRLWGGVPSEKANPERSVRQRKCSREKKSLSARVKSCAAVRRGAMQHR